MPRPAPASGPSMLHYILGITKAYTTRVGGGPFPTELPIDDGRRRAPAPAWATSSARLPGGRAAAAGSTPRLLKRSVQINGVSGLCLTKLDVLDGIEELKICTGYKLDGEHIRHPAGRRRRARALQPVYEEMPGWKESTVGVEVLRRRCRQGARAYIKRIEELAGVPIDMISTGPDREETIVMRHPYDV